MATNNSPIYKGKRHYDAKENPIGGIKVMVDGANLVEIEDFEAKICSEAYHSPQVLNFKQKTNREVIDYIHNEFSCKFEQHKADSGDFILCRLVVLDERKHDRKGNVRQILDEMQSEQSCKVSFGGKSMQNGGKVEPTEQELAERWDKKKVNISKLADSIRGLRNKLTRDIKGDDEKTRLTALAIAVIDKTAERVGNSDSADNGHFGVTGFNKRHIGIDGNTIYLKYVGKSGVLHEKQFSDELIANALKQAIKNSKCKYVFCTKDGFRINAAKINRYLDEYGVSAKDIRGYSANFYILDKLKKIEPDTVTDTESARVKKFRKCLKYAASKVGHSPATLKKHYLIPELEQEYINSGKLIDLATFYKEGGEIESLSEHKKNGGYLKLSKTPAPKSDRIYGSEKNKPQSAASASSAKDIELSGSVILSIARKLKEHNSKFPDKKISLSVAKAVVRRGMGAYSVTHRPTIKEGKPNSRVAWGLARLNAFLFKAANGHSKSGHFIQDDDLLDDLKIPHKKYEDGGEAESDTKHKTVGCFIYNPHKGFLLLQRGLLGEDTDGLWHVLSGGVDEGESLDETVRRELMEEIGYTGDMEIEFLDSESFDDYNFYYHMVVIDKPFIPKLNNENQDFKWVRSLDAMLHFNLIPKLKDYLELMVIGAHREQMKELNSDEKITCKNCSWTWLASEGGKDKYTCHKCGYDNTPKMQQGGSIDKNCIDFIRKTEAILKNGYYHRFGSFCFIAYNSGNQKDLNIYQTVNIFLIKSLSELLKIDEKSARNLISNYYHNARRFDTLDIINELKGCNIIIVDRDKIVCANNIQYDNGGQLESDKKELYDKWKDLVNMSYSELLKFYNSTEGKEAGLSPQEAKKLKIKSGRQSARWILRMKKTPVSEWTKDMWDWAKHQINFITRMRGNKGELYDKSGNKTRKHTSLLIWGHNPKKYKQGGLIKYNNGGVLNAWGKGDILSKKRNPDIYYIITRTRNVTDKTEYMAKPMFGGNPYDEVWINADEWTLHKTAKDLEIGRLKNSIKDWQERIRDAKEKNKKLAYYQLEVESIAKAEKRLQELTGVMEDGGNVIIGKYVLIPDLDAEYKLMPLDEKEPMYKQGYRYEGTISYPYSLGEMGNYNDGNFYKEIPTIQEIRKDILSTLNLEYEQLADSNNARDENIYNAIKKVLDKQNVKNESVDFTSLKKKLNILYTKLQEDRSVNKYDFSVMSLSQLKFFHKITNDLSNRVKHSKISVEKIGIECEITDRNEVKELTELAIVCLSRDIAHMPKLTEKEKYDKLVELYKLQPNLSHRTSVSIANQQYSTPNFIAYLMGLYCGIDKRGNYLENCAGNGMLTLAANPKDFIVNEIDDQRYKDLKFQNFKEITKVDATIKVPYDKTMDAMLTNPPFGSIDPIDYNGYEIKSLEQIIALRGLDTIKDNGKAAIIIGGHTEWDDKGRIKSGKNLTFFLLLNRFYNVEDVINVDGHKLYSRQGTGFDIRIILINGRKEIIGGLPPLLNKNIPVTEKHSGKTVEDFDTLFQRITRA